MHTEEVLNKDEAVCVLNSMCDQVTESIHSVCDANNLIKTVVRSVVVNIIGIMIAESVEIDNDSGTGYG